MRDASSNYSDIVDIIIVNKQIDEKQIGGKQIGGKQIQQLDR